MIFFKITLRLDLYMKVKPKNVVYFIVISTAVALFFSFNSLAESEKELLAAEIVDQDYYSMMQKMNYLKGSDAGTNFNGKVKTALQDGQISRHEYAQIMKEEATIYAYTRPEELSSLKKAKQEIIAELN